MEIELCYPDWKEKAVIFSYDDGQIYDRRLVEMLNHYKLKGTFHLNSAMIGIKGMRLHVTENIIITPHICQETDFWRNFMKTGFFWKK